MMRKKYYFYYNIALTYYILENENKTQEYLKKANDLHLNINSELKVKKIVNHDIEVLQNSQSQKITLIDKTKKFKNRFE